MPDTKSLSTLNIHKMPIDVFNALGASNDNDFYIVGADDNDKKIVVYTLKALEAIGFGGGGMGTSVNLIIPASSWNSATKTSTISNTNIKSADSPGMIGPGHGYTESQYITLADAKIVIASQGIGTLTLKCLGSIPTVDLPIILTY